MAETGKQMIKTQVGRGQVIVEWWWVRVLPPPGTLIWRFPGLIRPRCTAGATHKAAESYQGIKVHVPYSPFTFRFIVSRDTNFKTVVWSRVLYPARLFLLDE